MHSLLEMHSKKGINSINPKGYQAFHVIIPLTVLSHLVSVPLLNTF
jgi:hypothetical protein